MAGAPNIEGAMELAGAPSFEEAMERHLEELRAQLAAEHELAVQQAVGQHSQHLAQENAELRAELRALQQLPKHVPNLSQLEHTLRSGASVTQPEPVGQEELPSEQQKELVLPPAQLEPKPGQPELQLDQLQPQPEFWEPRTVGSDCSLLEPTRPEPLPGTLGRQLEPQFVEPGDVSELQPGQLPPQLGLSEQDVAPEPAGFAELLGCLYQLDDLAEFFAAALGDLALGRVYVLQRGCRECFRKVIAERRSQRERALRSEGGTAELEGGSSPSGGSVGGGCGPRREADALEEERAAAATEVASGLTIGGSSGPRCEADALQGARAAAAPEATAALQCEADAPQEEQAAAAPAAPIAAVPRAAEEAAAAEPEPAPERGECESPCEPRRRRQCPSVASSAEAPTAPERGVAPPRPALRLENGENLARPLSVTLRMAKPSWSARDLVVVQSKLAKVGITTSEGLALALLARALNDHLRESGLQTFASATLQALCKELRVEQQRPTEQLPVEQQRPVEPQSVDRQGRPAEQQAPVQQPQPVEPQSVDRHGSAAAPASSCGGRSSSSSRADASIKEEVNGLLGAWLTDEGRNTYEIRALDDGGFRGCAPPGHLGLWYSQRLATGELVAGALVHSTDLLWSWQADLSNGSRLRFRRSGPRALVSELWVAGEWAQSRTAERPQAYAFYIAGEHKEGHRYVHLANGGEGAGKFPIIGVTSGWVPATLPASGGGARLLGTFCDPFDVAKPKSVAAELQLATTLRPVPVWCKGKGKGLVLQDPARETAKHFGCTPQQLRERAGFRGGLRQVAKQNCRQGLALTSPLVRNEVPLRPLLSIVCVRWYDYWSDSRWSSDYSILNDGFFMDLFEGPNSPGRVLPGEFEVLTVFIRHSRDLQNLRPEHLRAMLRGRNVTAWYFLWPNNDGAAGEVHERDFFRLCQQMERLPLRMVWPHQSSLYRILCGKLWIPQMSLNSRYRVPPTVRVHCAELRQSARKTAERALEALVTLRSRTWGRPRGSLDDFKGVVKLGFSWCGSDVLPFRGASSLAKNLNRLLQHARCENTTCLVQELVPSVVGEHRVLVMRDESTGSFRKECMWMENGAPSESFSKHSVYRGDIADFKMASHCTVAEEAVAARFFKGDRAAQRQAESQAQRTVDSWLLFFAAESTEPVQCTRIDFLVSHEGPGQVSVWTCEVGENGASLCTVEVHGRNLAALNRAVIQDDSQRFPLPFPARLPRNCGEKG